MARPPLSECSRFSYVLAAVAVLAMSLDAAPAFAAKNCLQDVSSKHLTCTANDVSIAKAVNPRNLNGSAINTCFAGTNFSFIADFQVVTTATSRQNIGFYMATGGQANALTGTCVDNIVSPLHAPGSNTPPGGNPQDTSQCTQSGGTALCLGSSLYHENDTSLTGDNCGDTTSADGTNQFITVELDNIKCPAVGTTFMLPNCTSWQQPGGAILCASSPPSTGWPWVPAATPGSPSKCNCGSVSIPITPISYSMTATKVPSPASTPEPGGNFTYTVGVDNTTSATFGTTGSEIITQVCDNRYGNIATSGACSGGSNNGNSCTSDANCSGGTCALPNACPAGSLCTSPNNVAGSTCATNISCTLPQTVGVGQTVSNLCSFAGSFTGSEGSMTDTVTVNGFGNTGTSSPPAVSATANATVTISEGPATAQVSKSLDPLRECATVRYKVEVDNTSGASTDESEVLSVLNDNPGYGDVTKLGGTEAAKILGTTCGVATGQGTLSGSTGAGALPITIAPGGSYTCEFDGQFCAGLATYPDCTSGLEQTDTINATLTDDDSEGHAVTGTTSDTLKVDVCFSSSHP